MDRLTRLLAFPQRKKVKENRQRKAKEGRTARRHHTGNFKERSVYLFLSLFAVSRQIDR